MGLALLNSASQRTLTDVDLMRDDGVEGVVYTIRELDPDTAREIERRHTTAVFNPRTHQKEKEVNTEEVLKDCLDHCIVAWAGIVNPDTGESEPCDRGHKWRLDHPRKEALLKACGANREIKSPEARARDSFRATGSVPDVVDGRPAAASVLPDGDAG